MTKPPVIPSDAQSWFEKQVSEFRAWLLEDHEEIEKILAKGEPSYLARMLRQTHPVTLECLEKLKAVTSFAELDALETNYKEMLDAIHEREDSEDEVVLQ